MGARNETEGQTRPWESRTESSGNLHWSLFCRNPLSSAQQITETRRSSYMNTGKNQLRKRAAAFQKLDKILGSQDLFSACLKAHRAGQKPSLCLISPFWASVKKYRTRLLCPVAPQTYSKTVKELWFLLSSAADEGTLLWNALIWVPQSSVTHFSSRRCKSTLLLKTTVLHYHSVVAQRQKWVSTITHHSATRPFLEECGPPSDSRLVLTGSEANWWK